MSKEAVVNVNRKSLNQAGYRDLEHWLRDPNHVYIGRDMTHYVKGAVGSKWQNPFNVKKYGRDGCLEKFREHILERDDLLADLESLRGKTLGCWCHPEGCHGDILVELINEKKP